jgi:surface polysaccharide O-acyltransferase-like enzyme
MQKIINRDSNMELFRIVSMLLVLVYHTDYLTFGRPLQEDAINSPFNCLFRTGINSLSIICVNCFVLISGWFGIRPKIKRFAGLLFQVFFICSITLILYSLFGEHSIDFKDIKSIFLLTKDLWFVKAYIFLYLISPALNAYTQNVSQRQFLLTLIALFSFQTLYGWLFVSVNYINDGYSPLSFILLYLLAQYFRKYPGKLAPVSAVSCLYVFTSIVLTGAIVEYLLIRFNLLQQIQWGAYAYPLVIIESLFLLLFFAKLSFRNKLINWIASSCFAVYLLHCTRNILEEYCNLVRLSYKSYHVFGIIIVVICVFSISILLDKVRIMLWNQISNKFFVKSK